MTERAHVTPRHRTTIAIGLLGSACLASCGGPATRETLSPDGQVRVYGALREMFHEDRIGPRVSLAEMLPSDDLYAVGALAELAGEVTILGGEAHLARPEGGSARTERRARSDAEATLLVAANVPAWRSAAIERAIGFDEIDTRIAELAEAAGMTLDERFPFLLEGEFEDLRWHVIDGRRLTGEETSHRDHLAAAVLTQRDRTPAVLVGFYSEDDQGVFTHMGSRTHIHCVVEDPLAAGHVDHVVVPAGTTLKFPDRSQAGPGKR